MVDNPAVPVVEPWICPQVCIYIIAQHLCESFLNLLLVMKQISLFNCWNHNGIKIHIATVIC